MLIELRKPSKKRVGECSRLQRESSGLEQKQEGPKSRLLGTRTSPQSLDSRPSHSRASDVRPYTKSEGRRSPGQAPESSKGTASIPRLRVYTYTSTSISISVFLDIDTDRMDVDINLELDLDLDFDIDIDTNIDIDINIDIDL